MNLIIVESPAKGKTIEKFLGSDYCVMASYGHVRDLPKGKMGVDVKKNYEPEYIIPTKSKRTVSALKKAIAEADKVYLATDPDREGEAIAWHVAQATGLISRKLKVEGRRCNRISFDSITKEVVTEAVKNPREIDMNLVDAQQARRVIDRLVGYSLSPILWKKVLKGLSAGRVQSVAVRLVVEREREREKFKAQEYWSIEADLKKAPTPRKKIEGAESRPESVGSSLTFPSFLVEIDGKKIDKMSIGTQKEAEDIIKSLENANYKVIDVVKKETRRQPYAPFTTSTMQQEAANRYGWSAKQTMRVAQGLYEAGLITYMRTDSVSVNPAAISVTRKYIEAELGSKYLSDAPRMFKTKAKRAQEAHEAIRPTYPKNSPENIKTRDARAIKLYDIIWRRMIASQMADARYDNTMARINASGNGSTSLTTGCIFQANGIKIIFSGWRKMYVSSSSEDKLLPELSKGDSLDLVKLRNEQHFTEPPARYSEATLIKALEELGIGRPSTYAPTMATIVDRGYVVRESGRLMPEDIGCTVNDLLVKHFPETVDYDFTAKIEDELDGVAAGDIKWPKVVGDIYEPLEKKIAAEESKIEKVNTEEKTDEKCPECGKDIVIKRGRFGKFYACTGFPECKYTKPFLTEAQQKLKDEAESIAKSKKCPKCSSELVARKGKFGWFIGCSKYPECKYLENVKSKMSPLRPHRGYAGQAKSKITSQNPKACNTDSEEPRKEN